MLVGGCFGTKCTNAKNVTIGFVANGHPFVALGAVAFGVELADIYKIRGLFKYECK